MFATEKEAADMLNNFFESVFTQELDGGIPELPPRHEEQMITDFEFLVEEVCEQIKKL